PVTASDTTGQGYSYEVWLRLHFTGSGTSITNVKFWKSTAFSPSTGIVDLYGVTSTYTTPTSSASSVATTTLPTSTPGSQNVSIGGSLSGTLSSFPGFTDYIVLQ